MTTLHQAAERAGAHRWIELAIWRVLGAWAPDTPVAAAGVLWDVHAQHAAWRAEQWWERLPVLAGVERDDLVRAPTPASAVAVDRLAALDTTVARMAGAYRVVLPRLVARYGRDRSWVVPAVSDGPTQRTLRQVEYDAVADWRAGDAFLHLLLDNPEAIDEAAGTVATLERLALGDPAGEAAQRQADHQAEQRHPHGVDAT